MILGIRAHSVHFQLTVQIDKVSFDFYVFTKRWRFFFMILCWLIVLHGAFSPPLDQGESSFSYVFYLVEIGFALFDSFGIVNSYIAWKNHILKGKPAKERKYVKFGIRETRLLDRAVGKTRHEALSTNSLIKKAPTFGKHIKIG